MVFHFPEPEALGDCPACGKPVRHRGKVFTCETGRECRFVVFAEMTGRKMKADEVKVLLAEGQTPVLEGCVPRDGGKAFTGRLRGNGSRVDVERVDLRAEQGPAGACPLCQGQVRFSGKDWCCAACDFQVRGKIASRAMEAQEIRTLLEAGRTPRLNGFRHTGGSYFKAALVLDPEEGVSFDYNKPEDEQQAPLPPGSSRPAFERRKDCPVCLGQGERHPGYVIAGRSAWGCSRWKQGCGMRVPFVVEGVRLSDEEAQSLLGKKRKTRILKTDDGTKIGKLVFDAEAEPCWSLEPGRNSSKAQSP